MQAIARRPTRDVDLQARRLPDQATEALSIARHIAALQLPRRHEHRRPDLASPRRSSLSRACSTATSGPVATR
jgi:hypothetical protein